MLNKECRNAGTQEQAQKASYPRPVFYAPGFLVSSSSLTNLLSSAMAETNSETKILGSIRTKRAGMQEQPPEAISRGFYQWRR
jgi:hypothetical protein